MSKQKANPQYHRVWCLSCKQKKPPKIAGAAFLIPVRIRPDDLIQTVKMNDNSNDMILACADYGVSNGDTRFSDDDKLSAYLADAWGSAEFMIDCDPSLKHQVGERVAEISGILDFINDKIEAEELAVLQAEEDEIKSNVVDGDDLGNTDITLGQLHEDNTAATQLN